jgi:broad specificity phosphatase PhoE
MRRDITLYFVRHGETDWNAERRYQGQMDIPLNDKGKAQAKRNGEILRQAIPDLSAIDLVSSPLGRARETMTIMLGELGAAADRLRFDDRLRELSYGAWEGKLESELPTLDPEAFTTREKDRFRWRPAHGESYADLFARTGDWLKSVERDTLVASHGGVSRCLRAHVLGFDPELIPTLESPQDRVLVLTNGTMRWL